MSCNNMIRQLQKDSSLEQKRAIRFALSALGQRVEILSRCGEAPSQALEAMLCGIRMSPAHFTEWIPYEPGVNDDLPDLLRLHSKLIWRIMLSIKCRAGIRIFGGEEAQQAILNAINEYMKATNE